MSIIFVCVCVRVHYACATAARRRRRRGVIPTGLIARKKKTYNIIISQYESRCFRTHFTPLQVKNADIIISYEMCRRRRHEKQCSRLPMVLKMFTHNKPEILLLLLVVVVVVVIASNPLR